MRNTIASLLFEKGYVDFEDTHAEDPDSFKKIIFLFPLKVFLFFISAAPAQRKKAHRNNLRNHSSLLVNRGFTQLQID